MSSSFNIACECPHPNLMPPTKGFQMSNSILESCMVAPRAVALSKPTKEEPILMLYIAHWLSLKRA